jgi:ankyrin repeat protein
MRYLLLFSIAIGLLREADNGAVASPPEYVYHRIHEAAEKDDLETVRQLVDADPSLLNRGVIVEHWSTGSRESDMTPLYCAAEKGSLRVVEFLLAKKAKVNGYVYATGSPLHVAARHGHLAIVKALVEDGAYIDAANQWTASPLMMAVGNGHLDIVEHLLANGASADRKDNQGRSALQVAIEMQQLEVAWKLYQTARRVTDGDRRTLLALATEKQRDEIIAALKNEDENASRR